MQRLSLLLVLAALAVAGCDQDPTSAEDFDIQPAVSLTASRLEFTAGQSPAPTFGVRYQGLDSAPEAVAPAGVELELVEETGTPQSGTRTWAVRFTGDVPSAGSVETAVMVEARAGGRDVTSAVELGVSSPVSISTTFRNRLAVVEDYEGDGRQVTTTGGTTAEVVTDGVAPNSNGLRALRVVDSGAGGVVFERQINAPGQGVFSFLLRPETTADFTLAVTFADQAGSAVNTYTVDVPVEAGGDWRRYSIAATQLFEGFSPVAARSGGDGPLQSVTFSSDAPATYVVDDLAFGTASGPTIEVNDFESTSFFYIGATTFTDVAATSELSDGASARRFTYTDGGNFFGYNFQNNGPALFLDAGAAGVLQLVIGEVSKAFDLYVFVETDGGAYGYNSGRAVPVEAGAGFRTVTVPLANLGDGASALKSPGITNVGFEVRRPESDTSTDPISFVFDDVKLIGRD